MAGPLGAAKAKREQLYLGCNILRASRDKGFGWVDAAIAALELGFEADFEMREIHYIPAGEIPALIAVRLVLEAYNQVHSVVGHLVGCNLGSK